MKILLCIFVFVIIGFAKCQLVQKSSNDINSVDVSQTQVAYSNLKNLYIADLKTYKILSSMDVKSDKINVIKFNNSNLIIGLDSGYAIQINPRGGVKSILIDPTKTNIIDGITSINFIKDKIIFTLGNATLIIYDTINNIYKKSNLNLNSKITTTHIIGNALYIASFDRNIYKVELDTLKIDKIMQTSNLPTAMMDLNQELIIGLIDGNIIYKDKIYKISNNQISTIKIYKDNIYIGDWDSNLYIYDLNLNLKNSTKIGYDSILDIFISKNSQVILWNSAIFSCNFGIE
ncbi:hypothetical protein CVIC9261_01825 [Campylobacter vicugnae]|uniref:Uncharacterized protein n=3 Tax=Campylobacter TaxID=194 RepID=A0ABZ2E8S4_9BACT|nr:hypothetical protein [Campylobacter sp. RM12175]ARR03518.1 hypothetical protein CVIC12175_0370 [Campylobacter sp. RM12175]